MPDTLPAVADSPKIRAMRQRRRQERGAVVLLSLLAAAVFGGAMTWGLPSRRTDRFLFGDRPAWTGERVAALTGERADDADVGADVDRNPLADRTRKTVLNDTDVDRAEIVRRYRLFSHQPDEMVTLMALARMNPGQGDLDPKLYQYGGLWIYPVGVMLKLASIVGYLNLTDDLTFYLDKPEEFGRFYVVARLYVCMWGIVGAWAVFALTRRLSGRSLLTSCVASFSFVMMPVVVNMAHEAKPHLPGAVLTLLTVLAAVRYVHCAGRRWFYASAVLAGMASGMVLAAWPALAVPPVALLLVRQDWPGRLRKLLAGGAMAVGVYFATNPYVLVHLVGNRTLLASNLGNTSGMFDAGLTARGLANAARLVMEGTSGLLAVIGCAMTLALLAAVVMRRKWALRYAGWLLVTPAVLAAIGFVGLATDQPAEYGRFALFVDIALMVAAVVGSWYVLRWREWRPEILVVLGLIAAIPGSGYYAGYAADVMSPTSRTSAAQLVEAARLSGAQTVGVIAEPAPYAVPPLNLFDWQVVLLPKDYDPSRDDDPPDVVAWAIDRPRPPATSWAERYEFDIVDPVGGSNDMSWAGKPFIVLRRAGE